MPLTDAERVTFGLLRGWTRERAAAIGVPKCRVRFDAELARLAVLAGSHGLPAAAWCIVAPCRPWPHH